jgi:protein-tyrosine sulfotransferase
MVRSTPVIALAPAYFGASTLHGLLTSHPDLACTSGTGLLPLCEQAMVTWRNASGRPTGPPSSLAAAATRALVTAIITSILAREGKRRWCEIAAANTPAAEAFLRLYPETRFLCLYRAWPGVIRDVLDTSPWGVTDPAFTPFTRAYPASTVAALTAYWVTHTSALLAFERAHPQACLRVRFEDLVQAERQAGERITSFLNLPSAGDRTALGELGQPRPLSPDSDPAVNPPDHLIPPVLRAQVDDLLQELGYPAMTETTAG